MKRRLRDPKTRVKCVETWIRCEWSGDTRERASMRGINTGWTITLDRKSEKHKETTSMSIFSSWWNLFIWTMRNITNPLANTPRTPRRALNTEVIIAISKGIGWYSHLCTQYFAVGSTSSELLAISRLSWVLCLQNCIYILWQSC